MSQALKAYIEKTEEMLTWLEKAKASTKDNNTRDEVITFITEKIAEREPLMEQIQAPYSDEEKQLGQTAIKLDRQLQLKMNQLNNEIKADMRMAKKQQRTHSQYANPYNQLANADGMYLDSRK